MKYDMHILQISLCLFEKGAMKAEATVHISKPNYCTDMNVTFWTCVGRFLTETKICTTIW